MHDGVCGVVMSVGGERGRRGTGSDWVRRGSRRGLRRPADAVDWVVAAVVVESAEDEAKEEVVCSAGSEFALRRSGRMVTLVSEMRVGRLT